MKFLSFTLLFFSCLFIACEDSGGTKYESEIGTVEIDPPGIDAPTIDPPEIAAPEIDPGEIKFSGIKEPDIDMEELDYQGMKTFERDDYIVYAIQAEVLFDFDKSSLRPDAKRSLEQIAASIKKRYAGQPVQVHGHTDNKGTNAYNQDLSKKRANSVADWLNNQGDIEGNINKKWHGETQPVAANQLADGSDNPGGRQENRRVEIWVKKA